MVQNQVWHFWMEEANRLWLSLKELIIPSYNARESVPQPETISNQYSVKWVGVWVASWKLFKYVSGNFLVFQTQQFYFWDTPPKAQNLQKWMYIVSLHLKSYFQRSK